MVSKVIKRSTREKDKCISAYIYTKSEDYGNHLRSHSWIDNQGKKSLPSKCCIVQVELMQEP